MKKINNKNLNKRIKIKLNLQKIKNLNLKTNLVDLKSKNYKQFKMLKKFSNSKIN